MTKKVEAYIANHICNEIRSNSPLPARLCAGVLHSPSLRMMLRREVTLMDFPQLRALTDSKKEAVSNLGYALLRNIQQHPEVREYLEQCWKREDTSIASRAILQFHLLEYADLPRETQRELFEFVLNNWQQWLDEIALWCGGRQHVLTFYQTLLEDQGKPASKRWAFICAAAAADDRTGAREFISDRLEDRDPFVRDVARHVLALTEGGTGARAVVDEVVADSNRVINEYTARVVLDDIRAWKTLPTGVTKELSSYPLIDWLRLAVLTSDLDRLRSFCRNGGNDEKNLGRALMRNIKSDATARQEVLDFIQEMWRDHETSFRTRVGLQFELLDFEELTYQWRERLFEFTIENWQPWLDEVVTWVGTPQLVLPYCEKRLADDSVPVGKRWVYVCGAAAADDKTKAVALVRQLAEGGDLLTDRAAAEVFTRLGL